MLVTCPECGNKVSEGARRCLKCGFSYHTAMFSGGYIRSYDVCAKNWPKNQEDVKKRKIEELKKIERQSAVYKSPKQEQREWEAEEQARFEKRLKIVGVIVLVIIIFTTAYCLR